MRVCSRFTRRLTPHHDPHPTAARRQAAKPSYPSPIEGEEGTASHPRASAGLRQEENTAFRGRCLPGHDRLGWPSTGCERMDPGKHKRGPTRPCHDEQPAGRARSLPPDFSRLIATMWWSRRSRRPHGAGLVGRTSQPLHTRRVLEQVTELARNVKLYRRPGLDPGPGSAMSRRKRPLVPASQTRADPDQARVNVGRVTPLRAGARGACPR